MLEAVTRALYACPCAGPPVFLDIVDCGTEGGNLCPVRCPFDGAWLVVVGRLAPMFTRCEGKWLRIHTGMECMKS
jgi:hypothetical protein